VGPRASIPKGPPLPKKIFLKTASGKFWAPHSAGPACTARLARPIVTPLTMHLFGETYQSASTGHGQSVKQISNEYVVHIIPIPKKTQKIYLKSLFLDLGVQKSNVELVIKLD